jgi:hypothetical protein
VKGNPLVIVGLMVGLSHSVVTFASQSFKSQDAVVKDYTDRLNKGFEPFFTINPDIVMADKVDVNRDGSTDLVLFDKTRCESATECEIDVYLCTNDEELCEGGEYCFADSMYKDQIKKKGKALECK